MASFISELKRRNVFKVAAVYAVVAWLIIQVIVAVSEPLSLPDWLDTVVIVLLSVGFPIAIILAWAFDLTSQGIKAASDAKAGSAPAQPMGQRFSYISQTLILIAVGFLVVDQYILNDVRLSNAGSGSNQSAAQPVVRMTIVHPGTEPISGAAGDAKVAISRDGRHIAYLVGSTSPRSIKPLYVRALDKFEPTLLSNSARSPFFSPDGQWVGFVENNRQLSKVAITGGPSVMLDILNGSIRGASWGDDDNIVFATNDSSTGLLRISAAGGEVEVLTMPDTEGGEVDHIYPSFLPDGRGVLFTISNTEGIENSQIAFLDLETGDYRVLIQGGSFADYSASGHIVYGASGTLLAVPFDLERQVVLGNPIPVQERVVTDVSGSNAYSLAPNGTLVYLTGDVELQKRMLVWVDRAGREEPLPADEMPYYDQRLSPDGQRIALTVGSRNNSDIWIYDLLRDTMGRLTFDPASDFEPVWTPDSARVLFSSSRAGGGIFSKKADGTGSIEPMLTNTGTIYSNFLTLKEDQLVYGRRDEDFDLIVVSLKDGATNMLIEGQGDQEYVTLSPDGSLIAYESDESGREEIYVRPFPEVNNGKWQISSSGGRQPKWGLETKELFFWGPDAMMAVDIEAEPVFSAGIPESLFPIDSYNFAGLSYSVSPDGQRFLMFKPASVRASGDNDQRFSLMVVQNWFEELKRIAPPSDEL